jgi:hypothetical protein
MRYCPRHIPHNLIAGGGLNAYGGLYGHPDLGGEGPGAHHGTIETDGPVDCAECARLSALTDDEIDQARAQAFNVSAYCPRCQKWHKDWRHAC